MTLVTVNSGFSLAANGAASEFNVDFGIVRRLFSASGSPCDDGKTQSVARINNSAGYTRARFINAVQQLIVDDLRKLNIGEGGVEFPEDAYTAEYMVGVVSPEGVISDYVTVEVTDQADWYEFRQEIENSIQNELESGHVHGNDTRGLTKLYEVCFQTPAIPAAEMRFGN